MSDRLLILDDDPEFTAIVSRVAKDSGYEVLEVIDPTKFESALESWPPSHVMVDLNMPAIDGLESLQILARWRSTAKIVLCSAAARNFLDAVNRLGKRLGLTMSGILEKPLKATELKSFLETVKGEDPLACAPRDGFDINFFDEVCDTMGREWVRRGLTNLTTQLETTFAEQAFASVDRQHLARRAHMLVSYAGSLGFSELSRCCRELEEACNSGGDFSSSLHKAQIASRSACLKSREIIADLLEGRAIL